MALMTSPLEQAMMEQRQRARTFPPQQLEPQAPPPQVTPPTPVDPMEALTEKMEKGLPLSRQEMEFLNRRRKDNPDLQEVPQD